MGQPVSNSYRQLANLEGSSATTGSPEAAVIKAEGAAPLATTILIDQTNVVYPAGSPAPFSIAVAIRRARDGIAVPIIAVAIPIVISIAIAVTVAVPPISIPIAVTIITVAGIIAAEAAAVYSHRRDTDIPVLAGSVRKRISAEVTDVTVR